MDWLRRILGLCVHEWKVIKVIDVYGTNLDGTQTRLPIYTKFVLQCQHCGDIKTRTTA